MAALTADKQILHKGEHELQSYPIAAATTIYQGAMCKINAAGFLAPCAAEAGAFFAGVAYEQVINSGAAGAKSCRVYKKAAFKLPSTGLAQANVGDNVYASTDNDTSLVQGANEQKVGRIMSFESATSAYIQIDSAALI